MYLWEKYSSEDLIKLYQDSKSLKDFTKKIGYKAYRTKIINQIQEKYPNFNFRNIRNGTKDLSGQKINNLTVLNINKEATKKDGHTMWDCQCSCGKLTTVRSTHLINGEIISCLDCAFLRKRNFLKGRKFGLLMVIEVLPETINNRTVCKCKCDCGQIIICPTKLLLNNSIMSCGCLRTSRGEFCLKQLFIKENIPFEEQISFQNLKGKSGHPLRFDFQIFINNQIFLIEYQGRQHYCAVECFGGQDNFEKQQINDNKKREYCKNNKIPLIEIPYTDFQKISKNYLLDKIKEVI